ncbi:MAG TPA: type 1 glutamine amidotransferase [Mycobacteriales bacterium]
MARALVVEHVAAEHPGALGRWLPDAGVALDVCRLHAGDRLPARVEQDALVVMGGPMDARGDGGDLPAERALIARAVADGLPYLGICLGAQLLALATGGEVRRNPNGPEHGWGLVRKGDACADDPLFRTLVWLPDAVHWHDDEVSALPAGAVPLLRGEHTEIQAFRVGGRAWGLQLHPEVDEAMVARWADDAGVPRDDVLPFPDDVDLERTWRPLAEAFARVVRGGFSGVTLT